MDLAGGRQPICNEDGSIWVTQNGELFEYPELQQELQGRGHRLATRCDTQVVGAHLRGAARGCSKRPGQFAVLTPLGTRNTRTLILGRDRVGICPLYYTQADGWLLWGSEVKALLASGLVEARADAKGIDLFFNTFCARHDSHVLQKGVKSIPPGHYLQRPATVESNAKVLGPGLSRRRPGSGRRDPSPLVDELEFLIPARR